MGLSGGDFFPFLAGRGGGGITKRRSSTTEAVTADAAGRVGAAGVLPLVGEGRPSALLATAFLAGAVFEMDFLLSGLAADLEGALLAATFFAAGLAAIFLAATFLAGAFFAPDFFARGLAAILTAPLFFFTTTARTLF